MIRFCPRCSEEMETKIIHRDGTVTKGCPDPMCGTRARFGSSIGPPDSRHLFDLVHDPGYYKIKMTA